MSRRVVRVLLFVITAAAVASAAFFVFSLDRSARTRQLTHRQIDEAGHRGTRLVASVLVGLEAYVAPGQSETWWRARVRADVEALAATLATLRTRIADPSALNDLDAADDALGSLGRVEERAFALVQDGERTRASVLIYKEGLESSEVLRDRLLSALTFVNGGMDAAAADDQRRQAGAASAAALFALLTAALLLPRGRTAAAGAVEGTVAGPAPIEAAAPPQESVQPLAAIEPALPASVFVAAPATTTVAAEAAAAAPDFQSGRDRRKSLELRAAAELCTDFARLLDSQELPALLERAGRLVDASGIIVWIADPSSHELRPTLAYGYPPQTIARLPSIPRAADNATAAAYRRAEVEVVRTNGMSPGAIVTPILTAHGCIGVMAAEVRHGREASEGARALTRIIAAQLSTLLAVPAAQEAAAPADAQVATTG